MTNTSVVSGVVAFHTPASTELTSVSPYARKVNGTALSSAATTSACPPHGAVAGEALAPERAHREESQRAEEAPPERDPQRRDPRLDRDLDQREARPQMTDSITNPGIQRIRPPSVWLWTASCSRGNHESNKLDHGCHEGCS
ncbi:hypothetical protein ACFSTC_61955 [Nonomuraea ferruginea]